MSEHVVKLPDVGEGVAEAELVEWHVAVGDTVTSDSVLAEVLTDKATVEVYAPVAGVVAARHGEPGDVLAVGGDFVTITVEAGTVDAGTVDAGASPASPTPATVAEPDPPQVPQLDVESESAPEPVAPEPPPASPSPSTVTPSEPATADPRAIASPAVRARAKALGIDLVDVPGTGPDGAVSHHDLDALLTGGISRSRRTTESDRVVVEPVRGLRRKIADRLTAAWTEIPHITYVDSIDATEVESLRTALNAAGQGPRLTLLPFIVRAIVIAVSDQPRLNAHYDAGSAELSVFDGVHVGIATQTDSGLAVPVLRHAEGRDLGALAMEIARLAAATRANKATRDELSGSTITISSLGALGGLVTTPILNAPEVAIVGINRLEIRPVWRDGAFVPRAMFNVSASFDHRIVDGWDAAVFVQRIKALLETPGLLYAQNPHVLP